MNVKSELTDEIFLALSLPVLRCVFTNKASVENEQSILGFLIWLFAIYFMFKAVKLSSSKFYKINSIESLSRFKQDFLCYLVVYLPAMIYCFGIAFMIKHFVGNFADVNFYLITGIILFISLLIGTINRFFQFTIGNIRRNINT